MPNLTSSESVGRDAVGSIIAGAVIGVVAVVVIASSVALIFSGEMARFVPQGLGIGLLAGTVIALVVTLTSSYRGVVALPQDVPAAVFSVIAAEVIGDAYG